MSTPEIMTPDKLVIFETLKKEQEYLRGEIRKEEQKKRKSETRIALLQDDINRKQREMAELVNGKN